MAKKSLLFQFTQAQLTAYIKDKNSCVKCVPSKMHIGFPPHGLDNFKETLLSIISKKKIGSYDEDSSGIVLDVRNIKLEGTMSMIRYDSPELHLDINANFYVFQPQLGAILKGTVKHISKRHVSALIYNVFNVSIRLNGDFQRKLQVNKEISFRVKNFDLQNVLPYIEGELVATAESDGDSGIGDGKAVNKKKVFSQEDSSSSSESEDEKAFQSLVIKTEPQAKPTNLDASSSSEDSSSDSDEEDPKDKKKQPVLPKPIVEAVKKEKDQGKSKKKPVKSSSEESSEEDEPTMPVPLQIKKEKSPAKSTAPVKSTESKKKTVESSSDDSSDEEEPTMPVPLKIKKEKSPAKPTTPAKSSSAESSESDNESTKAQMPPSQFHTPKPMVTVKEEKKDNDTSSSDSDSSSDDDNFKIPMPKVMQVGGEIVIKREMTPTRRIKRESCSSSGASDAEAVKVAVKGVKKKVLQSPVEDLPNAPDFPVAITPTKKNKKTPTKEKTTPLPAPIIVKQEKENGKKAKSAVKVKQEPGTEEKKKKATRVSFAEAPEKPAANKKVVEGSPSPAKKAKKSPVVAAAPTKATESSDSSSSDDEDSKFSGSINLNASIQNLVSQIYTAKSDSEKETPTKKRKLSLAKVATPGEPVAKKTKKKKESTTEIDFPKFFGTDCLSSTRLDSATPVKKANVKVAKK